MSSVASANCIRQKNLTGPAVNFPTWWTEAETGGLNVEDVGVPLEWNMNRNLRPVNEGGTQVAKNDSVRKPSRINLNLSVGLVDA